MINQIPSHWKIYTVLFAGKIITYTQCDEFCIQVGKSTKGSYKHRNTVYGNIDEALKLYNAIEVKGGEKKRLVWHTTGLENHKTTSFTQTLAQESSIAVNG